MAQRTSKLHLTPGIKIRYNSSQRSWQVWTFFCGVSTPWHWVNCSARMAAWYYYRGAPNVTAPSVRVPFTEILHRQTPLKNSEVSDVQPIPQSQASF